MIGDCIDSAGKTLEVFSLIHCSSPSLYSKELIFLFFLISIPSSQQLDLPDLKGRASVIRDRGGVHCGYMKVKLPFFAGDPIGWIVRGEKFFEVLEIFSSDSLKLEFISMEGVAMPWFYSWC